MQNGSPGSPLRKGHLRGLAAVAGSPLDPGQLGGPAVAGHAHVGRLDPVTVTTKRETSRAAAVATPPTLAAMVAHGIPAACPAMTW